MNLESHCSLPAKSEGEARVRPLLVRSGQDARGGSKGLSRRPSKTLFLVLAFLVVWGAIHTESMNAQSTSGKQLFESSCAVCHGLDGAGGEHAPSIARGSAARALPDTTLFKIVHDGIAAKGMPSFNTLGDEKIRAILSHLRVLQGKSVAQADKGNPARGEELFFGKARCADCHAVGGQGQFISTDLTDFAYDHDADEIRNFIINPAQQGITPRFSVLIVTSSGQRISGSLRNENNSSIQIQSADGQFFLLAKSDVRSIERSPAPAMPEDYEQQLGSSEIADLVSYIFHQTSVRKIAGSAPVHHKRSRPE